MMPKMYTGLRELIAAGRPARHAVAYTADGAIVWEEFAALIAAHGAALKDAARILLAETDPIAFAARLLATLAAGKTPVIAPNFQPETLTRLQQCLDAEEAPIADSIEIYTSGSSGEPKRVVKRLVQFEAECCAQESLWGVTIGCAAVTATVPHNHIYGLLFRLLWPLLAGRPFDNVTCANPAMLVERLQALGEAILVSSPAQLSRLPELNDLATMTYRPKMIFSSGAPLDAATAQRYFTAWRQAPIEIFGSTESGGIAWRRQEGGEPVWAPLPGVTVASDDDSALLIRSPFLFDDQPLRMEDAVTLQPDGCFRLGGRLDRIVKIEEKRLSLPEMEARLAECPLVEKAAIVPLSSHARRVVVGAVIVASNLGKAQLALGRRTVILELRRHLARSFDAVLLPRRWRFVEHLPYNERSKLTAAALAALFEDDAE
ncbi:MAG: Acyl-CoA synthetase, AMP-(fatty) acid ligase [Proteobacteria bacterium]|nr:Acyl-CoA synthetase, AMP-(fatty) acid ligase [Pseudomonadota bacterium]